MTISKELALKIEELAKKAKKLANPGVERQRISKVNEPQTHLANPKMEVSISKNVDGQNIENAQKRSV